MRHWLLLYEFFGKYRPQDAQQRETILWRRLRAKTTTSFTTATSRYNRESREPTQANKIRRYFSTLLGSAYRLHLAVTSATVELRRRGDGVSTGRVSAARRTTVLSHSLCSSRLKSEDTPKVLGSLLSRLQYPFVFLTTIQTSGRLHNAKCRT